jgi:hypothetical protein
MPDDLIERLVNAAAHLGQLTSGRDELERILGEATGEIERLRRENEVLRLENEVRRSIRWEHRTSHAPTDAMTAAVEAVRTEVIAALFNADLELGRAAVKALAAQERTDG